MQQRKIVIFIILLFFLSSSYLFFINQKLADLSSQKGFWSLYFEDSKNQSIDFVIENYTDRKDFLILIYAEKNIIYENTVSVEKGKTQKVTLKPETLKAQSKKITVSVSSSGEKREIYKNFD